jgi:capsular exopolysaccharide synthesis family protein
MRMPQPYAQPPRDASFVKHYLDLLRRRKWLILGTMAIVLLLGLIATLLMTPKYTANTTLEIQRENFRIKGVEGVEPETSSVDMEFYQTQYGLLRSISLAEQVATELRLYDDPRFFEMFGASEAQDWFEGGRVSPEAPSREIRTKKAGEILTENIGVAPVRLSRLVNVGFTSPDPAFSMRVANAWAENFIEMTLERRFEATSYARRFLEDRLSQLRSRLEESERTLVGYAARQGIINIPTRSGGDGQTAAERSIVADDLDAINRELAKATAERVQAQSRLSGGGSQVQEALTNDAINALRERKGELEAEYSKMMAQFEPGYPAAVGLRQQIAQIDRAINREESRVQGTLRATYQASVARENALAGNVESLKSQLLDLRRRSIQYNIYQREVDTNRQLYDALLQRYKEIGVAGGIGVNNVSIVDPAKLPELPSSPKFVLNILLSLLAGLAAGVALALLREQIDDDVSDPSEMAEALGIPLLGAVPKHRGEDLILAVSDRKSDVAESYMAVQTNLAFSTSHGVPRAVAVTSTKPGEGKSTSAFALATSLARTGKTVILVDGDMRSPSVHHQLGSENARGLSNYLAGDDDVASLIRSTGINNFSVMEAGPQPPSASELLAGARLGLLVQRLQQEFDHVVIDAPPVMGLADAPLLASQVEGVVFVFESRSTKAAAARSAIERLRGAKAHLIGVIMTKFETKNASYGYGYGYGYGKSLAPTS